MGEHELKEMPQGNENWAIDQVAFISKNRLALLLSQVGDDVFTPCPSFGISNPTASCCLYLKNPLQKLVHTRQQRSKLWFVRLSLRLSQLEVGWQNDSASLHLKTHSHQC